MVCVRKLFEVSVVLTTLMLVKVSVGMVVTRVRCPLVSRMMVPIVIVTVLIIVIADVLIVLTP